MSTIFTNIAGQLSTAGARSSREWWWTDARRVSVHCFGVDWRSRSCHRKLLLLDSSASPTRLRREEDGQDLLEYGLLCALIAVVAIGAVTTVGNTIHSVFWQVIANTY